MAVYLSLFAGAGQQFFTNAGVPLAGGKIYTYGAGGSTPQATYTTSAGNIAHSNPIVLDAAGRVSGGGEIWLTEGLSYKFVIQTSANVTVQTLDNIFGGNDPTAILALLAASSGSSLIGFIQSGAGAVQRTAQSKMRESVSVLDFGAVPNDSSTTAKLANDAAFAAAIASFVNNAVSAPYSGGGTILVPQGTYYLSDTISISRQIILSGVTTPDGNAWSGSILVFPTSKTGLRIYDYRTSPAGTDAGGTTIENLVIRTTRNAAAAESGYHGVHADTRFTIRNSVIGYFGDNGINIVATAGGSPNGNANNWRIDNVRCAENGFDGLFVDGADVNAGVAVRLDCSSNLRWGIFDSSFLGNTYVGCHTASNGTGAYKTDNANARNVFLGCYSESGQPASEFVAPTLVLGGIHAAGFSAGTTAYMFDDGKVLAAPGTVSEPSLSFAVDKNTGFFNSSDGRIVIAVNGANRGTLTNGAKFTTDGTYWAISQSAHEFIQDSATLQSSIDYLKSTSYTGIGKYIKSETASGTGYSLMTLANAAGTCMAVLGNGNVQNTNNSYGAISDVKLKQDITDATSQWNDIKSMRLKKYRLKSDPDGPMHIGVIAQELEEVSPGLVEEVLERDANGELTGELIKTVKYSVLMLKAVGALQEAQKRIEELEARVQSIVAK